MASSSGGEPLSTPLDASSHHDADDALSESGSSYIGSDESEPIPNTCTWRTAEFYDQECSRYFDCPSHLVERSLSDTGSRSGTDDAASIGNAATAHTGGDHDAESDREDGSEDDAQPRLVIRSDSMSSGSESGHPAPVDTIHQPPGSPSASSADNGGSSQLRGAPTPLPQLPIRSSSLQSSLPLSPISRVDLNHPLPQPPGSTLNPTLQDPEISPHTSRARTSTAPSMPRSDGAPRDFSDILLPRWQPDADVTICPICRTQFSFFVRKHHCRKCGRVVCNACSPHRITIPHQYIVRPPGQARGSQLYLNPLSGDDGLPYATGGERVRLCNPCVPDPNTTPPLPITSPTQGSPRPSHYRSQSNLSRGFGGFPQSPDGGFFMQNPAHGAHGAHVRGRSITMNTRPHAGSRSQMGGYVPTRNQILAGTPPVYYPAASSSGQYPGSRQQYRSLLEPADASSSTQRPLPLPPQIAEEDECPVCHRELPSNTLPNYEALRESHINTCITAHSTYGGGAASTPDSAEGEEASTPASPRFARRTGMFPYVATEKDCVDSAECTICLEEFEVGVPMARLECLCRFHHRCISAWFVNHPGRCPVHQHDSYGY